MFLAICYKGTVINLLGQALIQSVRYPESRKLGFIRMGLGIEYRATYLREAWAPHLNKTKEIQKSFLADTGMVETILVLGAGRLLDIDLASLSEKAKRVVLVDADPLCVPFWKKAAKKAKNAKIDLRIQELSGLLPQWYQEIKLQTKATNFFSSLEKLETFSKIDRKQSSPIGDLVKLYKPDVIISVNLLSQIPVMWQDVLSRIFSREYTAAFFEANEEKWLRAYLPSARALIRQHLWALNESKAKRMLLISDLEYLRYPSELQAKEKSAMPFLWEQADGVDSGSWVLDKSHCLAPISDNSFLAKCQLIDALNGLNLENEKLRDTVFTNYHTKKLDNWLWHICPLGAEGSEVGTIHRVAAFDCSLID